MSRIFDGYPTTISFGNVGINPDAIVTFTIWEKTVTPPDASGGGPIPATTMRNLVVRTFHPKSLVTVGKMTLMVAYDPAAYLEIGGILQLNQTITVTFPDTSFLSFKGWLEEFKPNELKEGEEPLAQIVIEVSNLDDFGNEVLPQFKGFDLFV